MVGKKKNHKENIKMTREREQQRIKCRENKIEKIRKNHRNYKKKIKNKNL